MSKLRTFAVAVICAGALFGAGASPAGATILFSVTPILTVDPATVGQTGLPGSLVIANDSTAPDNQPTVEVTDIRFTPSCGAFTSPPCTSPEPGVITVSSTATGAFGSACANLNFPFAVTDNATGEVAMTIPPGTFTLPSGSECRINFTYNVVKFPAVDSQGEPGLQTDQILHVRFFHPGSFDPVDEIGSDFTTIDPAPMQIPPVTSAPTIAPTPTPPAAVAHKKKCKKKKGKKAAVTAKKCKKKKK